MFQCFALSYPKSDSMSRKIPKSMERDGQRRRSPRISALDCKENHQKRQLCRTRSRMKRKADGSSSFSPVSKLAKQVWKGRDSPRNADNSADFLDWTTKTNQKRDDHATANGKQSIIPAKHVLELVLDTLQRRDSYEIFAEPVDPDEVEDYYEIIEEPMDFGTMRAKLHEGLYQNLEQFEHDVFLIPENAMHFNSSATIYFRQARAIHDLAKKVFHVLKTDPENFVSEFSGTRRRSMRKALSESKDSRFAPPKPNEVCSPSTFKRTNKKTPAILDHFRARNLSNGSRESGILLSSSEAAERRSTYSCRDKVFVDYSISYTSCTPMILMNQGEISYRDSLMSFVKGLGSTAEKVAKRKLLGLHEEAKRPCLGSDKRLDTGGIHAKEFKTFRDFAGGNPFLKVIDLTKDTEAGKWRDKKGKEESDENREKERGETENDQNRGNKKCDENRGKGRGETEIDQNRGNKKCDENRGKGRGETEIDQNRGKKKTDENRGKERGETEIDQNRGKKKTDENRGKERGETENDQNKGREKNEMMKRVGRELSCWASKSNDDGRPVILALESAHSEFKSRIRRNAVVSTQPPPLPIVSRFAFDLTFLKARLSQMTTAVDRGGKLQF